MKKQWSKSSFENDNSETVESTDISRSNYEQIKL